MIWNKSNTKNSQLWSDQWTTLLYGAICSVHVYWYTIVVQGVTKLQELCWPAYKIYLPAWSDSLDLCTHVLVTGHTIMSKCSMTWKFITAYISTQQTYNIGLQHQKCTPFVTVLRSMAGCFMSTKQKYQDALCLISCFIYFSLNLRKWLILWLVSQIQRHNERISVILLYKPTLVYAQKPTPNITLHIQTQIHQTLVCSFITNS